MVSVSATFGFSIAIAYLVRRIRRSPRLPCLFVFSPSHLTRIPVRCSRQKPGLPNSADLPQHLNAAFPVGFGLFRRKSMAFARGARFNVFQPWKSRENLLFAPWEMQFKTDAYEKVWILWSKSGSGMEFGSTLAAPLRSLVETCP
jgi:hypothetical protein